MAVVIILNEQSTPCGSFVIWLLYLYWRLEMSITRLKGYSHYTSITDLYMSHLDGVVTLFITWQVGCPCSVKGPLWLNSHHECIVLCCVPLLCCLCIAVRRRAASGAELRYFVNVYFDVKIMQPAWSIAWCQNAVWPDLARFSTKKSHDDEVIFVFLSVLLVNCCSAYVYTWMSDVGWHIVNST